MAKKIEISDSAYRNNLLLYSILKGIVQSKLSENQMQHFRIAIKNNKHLAWAQLYDILSDSIVKKTVKAYDNYIALLNLGNAGNAGAWCDLTILATELLSVKPLLIEESKRYVAQKYEMDALSIKDKLSWQYDLLNLEKPYGQRVLSALLVYALSSDDRENEFLLETTAQSVKNLNQLVKDASERYQVNTNNIFMIIMDESINQSIISDAGNSYEDRVYEVLSSISDSPVRKHLHDKNIPSVEYDDVFTYAGKEFGVSAKRTLRERYKQNFEDVSDLSVDAVFIITLGIDLNNDKLSNILQRQGYFVVVAQEIYEANDYMKRNKRVISSKNLNVAMLEKFIRTYQ